MWGKGDVAGKMKMDITEIRRSTYNANWIRKDGRFNFEMASKNYVRRDTNLHFWEVSQERKKGYAGGLWGKVRMESPKEWVGLWSSTLTSPELWDSKSPWVCKISQCQVKRVFQEWKNDKWIRQNDPGEILKFGCWSDNDHFVSNHFLWKDRSEGQIEGWWG